MFRGIHTSTLDAKGRLGLPLRAREALAAISGPDVVVTVDTHEKCLLLYPLAEWEIVQSQVQTLPNYEAGTRNYQRFLMGPATDLQVDGNGRVLLPSVLRTFAALDRNAVIVGLGNKFEIWAEESWNAQMESWLASNRANAGPASEAMRHVRI